VRGILDWEKHTQWALYIAPSPIDLDGDGLLDTGLVCALSDYGNVSWGCYQLDLLNVPNPRCVRSHDLSPASILNEIMSV